jgi:hypothetical protein
MSGKNGKQVRDLDAAVKKCTVVIGKRHCAMARACGACCLQGKKRARQTFSLLQ